MKVITAEPMMMEEIVELTGKDALYNLADHKCRIMNMSPDQEIDVDFVMYDGKRKWGLRKTIPKAIYEYIAVLVQ